MIREDVPQFEQISNDKEYPTSCAGCGKELIVTRDEPVGPKYCRRCTQKRNEKNK